MSTVLARTPRSPVILAVFHSKRNHSSMSQPLNKWAAICSCGAETYPRGGHQQRHNSWRRCLWACLHGARAHNEHRRSIPCEAGHRRCRRPSLQPLLSRSLRIWHVHLTLAKFLQSPLGKDGSAIQPDLVLSA